MKQEDGRAFAFVLVSWGCYLQPLQQVTQVFLIHKTAAHSRQRLLLLNSSLPMNFLVSVFD